MSKRLADIVQEYNSSGKGKAILQEYDAHAEKAFILCIVTNLMFRVHKKVLQAAELCYMNASALFNPLNSSITLFYISCAAEALLLERAIYHFQQAENYIRKVNKPIKDDSSIVCLLWSWTTSRAGCFSH